jgi:cobalamin biosynthesis Mg chelatase CobN
MATRNVKPFNTETAYLLWDEDHDTAGVRFVREDANSVVFDDNGIQLVFEQATVVNLGSRFPPAPAAREAGKHYISTDDSGASNQEYSLPASQESGSSLGNSQGSGSSQATGANETQAGGRRKGKGKKTKKARKSKSKKTKKSRK